MSNIVKIESGVPLLPTPTEWALIKEQAALLVKSGFLPNGIDTPEKALAIALKGREMGVPMMQAFSHISIINGKPCVSSELMLSQIRRLCPGALIQVERMEVDGAAIIAARPGGKPAMFEFNKADAERANLLGKGPWKQFPKVMYYWRCVSMMARAMFPDAIMGASYTPEEMGAEVNEEGEVIDIPSPPSEPVKAPPLTEKPKAEKPKVPQAAEEKKNDLGSIMITEKQRLFLERHGIPEARWEEASVLLKGCKSEEGAFDIIQELKTTN